ncbi:MAG: TRAP transporter small permease subunit [Burkholderiaceae bacterium]
MLDRIGRSTITWFTCSLLAPIVAFTIYTVVMRYVFNNPPFWGDTVALFRDIWRVLLAYALAVRDREDIASEGIYKFLTAPVVNDTVRWQKMADSTFARRNGELGDLRAPLCFWPAARPIT